MTGDHGSSGDGSGDQRSMQSRHRSVRPEMEGSAMRAPDDGNFRRSPETGSMFGPMGRASGKANAAAISRRDTDNPETTWARERTGPFVGLSIVDQGRLEAPDAGHPAGTPYVVIRANCLQETVLAENLLREHAGVPDMAWEQGWRAQSADADYAMDLTIFPSLTAAE